MDGSTPEMLVNGILMARCQLLIEWKTSLNWLMENTSPWRASKARIPPANMLNSKTDLPLSTLCSSFLCHQSIQLNSFSLTDFVFMLMATGRVVLLLLFHERKLLNNGQRKMVSMIVSMTYATTRKQRRRFCPLSKRSPQTKAKTKLKLQPLLSWLLKNGLLRTVSWPPPWNSTEVPSKRISKTKSKKRTRSEEVSETKKRILEDINKFTKALLSKSIESFSFFQVLNMWKTKSMISLWIFGASPKIQSERKPGGEYLLRFLED